MSEAMSLQERIAARRRELQEESDTLDLVVPAWDGVFNVRYRLLSDAEGKKHSKLASKAQRENDIEVLRAVTTDILVASCECILAPGEKEVFEPLTDDADNPVRFDDELGRLLGLTTDDMTARQVATAFFSPEGHYPDSIFEQAEVLGQWRRGRLSEVNEALLGE